MLRHSKRRRIKLKPNRAQRDAATQGFIAKGAAPMRYSSVIPAIHLNLSAVNADNADHCKPMPVAPPIRNKQTRRGPWHGKSREAKQIRLMQREGRIGTRKPGPVGGLTHCAAKRAERTARLGKTLNQHAA